MLKSELRIMEGADSKGRGGGWASPSFDRRRSPTAVENGGAKAAPRPLAAEADTHQRVTLLSVSLLQALSRTVLRSGVGRSGKRGRAAGKGSPRRCEPLVKLKNQRVTKSGRSKKTLAFGDLRAIKGANCEQDCQSVATAGEHTPLGSGTL